MSKSVYSLLIGIVAGFLLQSTSLANADENLFHKLMHKIEHRKSVIEFDETDIYLEQNFTDGDTEVILLAKTEEFGLRKLWIFSPRGELIYKFKSPDNGNNLESQEAYIFWFLLIFYLLMAA